MLRAKTNRSRQGHSIAESSRTNHLHKRTMDDREQGRPVVTPGTWLPRLLTMLMVLVFVTYITLLIKITLIKSTPISDLWANLLSEDPPLRALNLIPGRTVMGYWQYRHQMTFLRWFANIVGNVLIFVPLGLYLPALFNRMKRFSGALAVVAAFSFLLEALQHLFGTGTTDIDDFLLNTAGGMLGFALFLLVARVKSNRLPAPALILIMSLCFGIAGYVVADREFGMELGLAPLPEEIHGKERLPDRPAEAVGFINDIRPTSFVLTDLVKVSGAADLPRQEAGVEVVFDTATEFTLWQSTVENRRIVTQILPSAPAILQMEAMASVWGRWEAGHLRADVVQIVPSQNPRGQIAVSSERNASSEAWLPGERPALQGHFKGRDGDDVLVQKIVTRQYGRSMIALGTSIEATFRLSSQTVFRKKRILRMGREVHRSDGDLSDLVPGVSLDVWGRMQGKILVADSICVNTFK